MTTPLACLLFFAAWTLAIVTVTVAPYRVGSVLVGKARPNSFNPATIHGPDWYQRCLRAHANSVENLPVFGAIVLTGHAMGVTTGLFATLSVVYVAARVGQTLAHVLSGRSLVVNVRFAFFATQVACAGLMIGVLAVAR